ncbi:hypothetical protein M1O54_07220 [Dehalococcoidia bacterium]|nr:hypothetical protein [Dehalococcoidia bacterium]MCL0079795.1 hypothetical protein [Dehalococcoidia bacterium]MCL0090118.1 hypothetical protein [Dehalococcoidia bacterium]
MPAISPKLGEFLVEVTHSKSIDDALHEVFSDYLELKLRNLHETIEGFQKKWGMDFEEFQKRIKEGSLKKDAYSFEVENDFWQWEEVETLKSHYNHIKEQWM